MEKLTYSSVKKKLQSEEAVDTNGADYGPTNICSTSEDNVAVMAKVIGAVRYEDMFKVIC